MKEFIVKENSLLYEYLRKYLTWKSKNNIKALLKNNSVKVNNKIVTKYDYLLNSGDIITINEKPKKELDLDIIYEDDDIIVIDKPSKMLTIGNKKEKENTLYRRVSNYLKRQNKKVFIIHRLDYDTSGVIMFAKSEKIKNLYQKNWNNLAKKREYTAIVEGITENKGHIESYLKENRSLFVYSSSKKDGLFSITDYVKITNNDNYSLLKIYISTGRRNQIRCHMSDINHPLIGDKRYNAKSNPIGRLGLHASTLEVVNPKTNKLMIFKSKVPDEFINIVK